MRPMLPELEAFLAPLYDRLRIAVIHGGDKEAPDSVLYRTRNTRGTKTYQAVASDIAEALRTLGFRNVLLLPEDMRLADRLRSENVHLAWLNSGGRIKQ